MKFFCTCCNFKSRDLVNDLDKERRQYDDDRKYTLLELKMLRSKIDLEYDAVMQMPPNRLSVHRKIWHIREYLGSHVLVAKSNTMDPQKLALLNDMDRKLELLREIYAEKTDSNVEQSKPF